MQTGMHEWMFRCITFEADAQKFQDAGVKVGADKTVFEVQLFQEALSPFSLAMRNEALRMARMYAILYSFENSARELIRDRLSDRHGSDWWEAKVGQKIKLFAANRRDAAEKNTWLQGAKTELILFCDFGHLSDIIISNWGDFEDLFVNQHWLKQRLDELEKVRNFIAHNRLLQDGEFQRIEMYISDWNRQVGL